MLRCTDRCTIVDTRRHVFALSDPTRREILERLGGGPATISELAKPLTINGLKKHVGVLAHTVGLPNAFDRLERTLDDPKRS